MYTMILDKNKLECRGTEFVIKDDTDKLLFSANSEEVVVGVDTLKINGNGGVVFEKSLNTPLVRADISKNLTCVFDQNNIFFTLNILSNFPLFQITIVNKIYKYRSTKWNIHGIKSRCYRHKIIKKHKTQINERNGKSKKSSIKLPQLIQFLITFLDIFQQIDLSGSNVLIRQLQKASPEITPYRSRFKMKKYDVFQLCICGNGRLFLANANGICGTFDSDLICA